MSSSSQEDLPEPRRDKRCWFCRGGGGWEDGGPHGGRGALLAEAAGAALLVLLSCLPACAGAPAELRPIAAGLVVALLVQCFDHISGAMMNPTVLLAAWLARRVRPRAAGGLLAAQLVGAVLGGGLLVALAPGDRPAAVCLTLPRHDLSVYKAVAIEAVLGGALALASQAAWDARARRRLDSWPLRVGLGVAGLSVVAGDLTGASMNPVRSFSPALWSGRWEHHWVYWVGPLSGSLVCSLLYRCAWAPRAPLPRPPAPSAPAAPAAPPAAPAGRPHKTHNSV